MYGPAARFARRVGAEGPGERSTHPRGVGYGRTCLSFIQSPTVLGGGGSSGLNSDLKKPGLCGWFDFELPRLLAVDRLAGADCDFFGDNRLLVLLTNRLGALVMLVIIDGFDPAAETFLVVGLPPLFADLGLSQPATPEESESAAVAGPATGPTSSRSDKTSVPRRFHARTPDQQCLRRLGSDHAGRRRRGA